MQKCRIKSHAYTHKIKNNQGKIQNRVGEQCFQTWARPWIRISKEKKRETWRHGLHLLRLRTRTQDAPAKTCDSRSLQKLSKHCSLSPPVPKAMITRNTTLSAPGGQTRKPWPRMNQKDWPSESWAHLHLEEQLRKVKDPSMEPQPPVTPTEERGTPEAQAQPMPTGGRNG